MYWTLTSSKFCISEITVEFAILRTLWTIDSKYLDKSGHLLDHVTMCTAGGSYCFLSIQYAHHPLATCWVVSYLAQCTFVLGSFALTQIE